MPLIFLNGDIPFTLRFLLGFIVASVKRQFSRHTCTIETLLRTLSYRCCYYYYWLAFRWLTSQFNASFMLYSQDSHIEHIKHMYVQSTREWNNMQMNCGWAKKSVNWKKERHIGTHTTLRNTRNLLTGNRKRSKILIKNVNDNDRILNWIFICKISQYLHAKCHRANASSFGGGGGQ